MVEVHRRFGETCSLFSSLQKTSQARRQEAVRASETSVGLLSRYTAIQPSDCVPQAVAVFYTKPKPSENVFVVRDFTNQFFATANPFVSASPPPSLALPWKRWSHSCHQVLILLESGSLCDDDVSTVDRTRCFKKSFTLVFQMLLEVEVMLQLTVDQPVSQSVSMSR
jgi:hypothetical protein